MNNPNLVLFVGEALVGNDGIDQLACFDKVVSARVRAARASRYDVVASYGVGVNGAV